MADASGETMIKVYSNLTLDPSEIRSILPEAITASPVKQGDIYGDLDRDIRRIIIIDGKFHQSLSVTCGELMDALRRGVSVYGASSMGAMRAAELNRFGMVGVGKIYEMIKTSRKFRDDYLGQVFTEESQLRSLSVPYVDFHFNLETLSLRGAVSQRDFRTLTNLYGDLYYPERNWPTLHALIRQRYGESSRLLAPAKRALLHMGSQKKRDALDLLRLVRDRIKKEATLNALMASERDS